MSRCVLAVVAAAAAFGIAACGTPTAGPPADPHAHGSQHTPGMVMPDGSTMGPTSPAGAASQAPSTTTTSPADAGPPPTALMVCKGDVKDAVKQLSGLSADPQTTATWTDKLYTCTYTLPEGVLVLSVKQSANADAAQAYFAGLEAGAAGASKLEGLNGLGLPSYKTASGTAAFVKDDMTLLVDATKMPAMVGPEKTERSSYAFTVASNVLVCWKEHGGSAE